MTAVLSGARGTTPADPRGHDRPATTGWRFGRYFTLRVAGLPVALAAGLRCPASSRWAADLLSTEDALARGGAELSDLLHDLIGANADEAARRRLLALRRQVFKNAVPAGADEALATVRGLDPAVADRLDAWLRRRREFDAALKAGDALLADEVARSRSTLWGLIDEPRLRGGLQLASPGLDTQLHALFCTEAQVPTAKKLRKIERSVLSYLYRTACKTSPFSTLTGVAVGEFGGGSTGLDLAVAEDWHSYVRLNVVVLSRLTDLATADRARRADLIVTLSPGWRLDGDRVRYVRHWTTVGDDTASVSFDSVRDGLFFLRRSGILDRLTTLMIDQPLWRCRDVVAWLRHQVDATPDECEEYLSVLLELGMLQLRGFAPDVHTPDPLRAMREALAQVGRDWSDALARRLDEPIALVDAYRTAGLARRRTIMVDLRRVLHGIQKDLGAAAPTLPQTLLYEDVRAGTAVLPADSAAWHERFGPDLSTVEQVLPAYDMTLPHRVTLHGFFLARFGRGGRCDDLLKLVEDFHEDLYDQYSSYTADRRSFDEDGNYTPEENWLGRPEMSAIDGARQELAAYLRRVYADHGGEPEVVLDRDLFAGIGARLAGVTGGQARPQGHFAQVADRPDGPWLVLNQSFGGLSFPFSRFTHCFDGLPERLREQAAVVAPPGAVFAEVTGGPATTNLNLHGQLTDHVIVTPGELSTVPVESQLSLDDLYLEHDEATDRVLVRSKRLGREVVPVYLGYLMPMALPRIPRTLLLLSPASMVRLDIWTGVPRGPETDGVATRPRVRLGNVVLGRRTWSARVRDLPVRTPGQSDTGWYLQWQRWRHAHGVPAQVFVTTYPADRGTGAANPKPQYLDFDSYLCLLAFEANLGDGQDRAVIREMLPADDELNVRSGGHGHVAEFAIETHHIAGGDRT